MHFNFIASNSFDLNNFNEVDLLVDFHPDFQSVFLKDEEELKLLFRLMNIDESFEEILNSSEFDRLWNISSYKLPEFNEEQFDRFFQEWIKQSGREYNMDEFGQLIFLQGLTPKWNQLSHRLVVRETN